MEYRITVNGLDARITIERGAEAARAYGITFDEHATIVADARPARWSGYCDACIVYDVASAMLVTRRRIECDDVADALERAGLTCMCGN